MITSVLTNSFQYSGYFEANRKAGVRNIFTRLEIGFSVALVVMGALSLFFPILSLSPAASYGCIAGGVAWLLADAIAVIKTSSTMACRQKIPKNQPSVREKRLQPIAQLPSEINAQIFSYLEPEDLARSSLVNKEWNALANDRVFWDAFDLKRLFPSLKIFDESNWAAYGLIVDDIGPLNKRECIPKLKQLFSLLPKNKMILLTIPRNFTYEKLLKLVRKVIPGFQDHVSRELYITTPLEGNHVECIERFGNTPVNKTYRIVIASDILLDSEKLSFSEQKQFVSSYGCRLPEILEAATLKAVMAMTKQAPSPYFHPRTQCIEQFNHSPIIFGSSSDDRIFVFVFRKTDLPVGAGAVLRLD